MWIVFANGLIKYPISARRSTKLILIMRISSFILNKFYHEVQNSTQRNFHLTHRFVKNYSTFNNCPFNPIASDESRNKTVRATSSSEIPIFGRNNSVSGFSLVPDFS